MSFYTKFHFRAKLAFDLPEPIRLMLRNQFQSAEKAQQMHQALLHSEVGASAAAMAQVGPGFYSVGEPYPGPYYFNTYWVGHPEHAFFKLDRANQIPNATNWSSEFPKPFYKEYPDGSSHIEFTCEINHSYEEIHEFLDWIKPYVRLKFSKRNRGRNQVWVGYWSSEDMTGRVNVFIKSVATDLHPAMLFGREVIDDYSQKGTW